MPILKLPDVDLYYESQGAGRPFLFNAATATWGELWKFHQVADFSRDHQVIIFDQRGTGRSQVRSTDFSTAGQRSSTRWGLDPSRGCIVPSTPTTAASSP